MYTHQCEEFRERITEQIIDREDLSRKPELQKDLLLCPECADFYAEARETIEAIASVESVVTEDRWDVMADRLRLRILAENSVVRPIPFPSVAKQPRRISAAALLAAAALLLITIGLYRVSITDLLPSRPAVEYSYFDYTVPIDPVTVDFLKESELLLRNWMKISPQDVDDLEDARKAASSQLLAIQQRKEAAAVVPPVLKVMETYESVLRDIRNLNDESPEEDIGDIQNRIQSNALIANMKAFQPSVSVIQVGLR